MPSVNLCGDIDSKELTWGTTSARWTAILVTYEGEIRYGDIAVRFADVHPKDQRSEMSKVLRDCRTKAMKQMPRSQDVSARMEM